MALTIKRTGGGTAPSPASDSPPLEVEARTVETAPAGAGGSLAARFRKAKSAPAQVPVDAPKKGLFAFAKRPAKASDPKPAAPASDKPKKGKTKAARPGASRDTLLMTELEDGRQVFWRVTPSQLEVLPEEAGTPAGPVISFSRHDIRVQTRKPLSDKAASALALEELAEDVRIVNASKKLGAVFATTADRVKQMRPAKLVPGGWVLEQMRTAEAPRSSDEIVVLHLTGGGRDLAVLCAFTADGDLLGKQITVNADDIGVVLAQFQAEQRLDPDATTVHIYQNAEFLAVAPRAGAYPSEAMVAGVPLSTVVNIAAMGALAAALGAGGWAAAAFASKQSAQTALTSAKRAKDRSAAEADALLMSSVGSFSRTQALDIANALKLAHAVWVPGSTVSMEAGTKQVKLTVTLPVLQSLKAGASAASAFPQERETLLALLDREAPDSCVKTSVSFTGGLRAVQVFFECQTPAGPLPGYSLD